jgi:hypothetical protein
MSNEHARASDRRHRTRAEADQIAADYESSGLTQQAYSERHRLALKTLTRYVARYRRANRESATPGQWVAVEVSAKSGATGELAVLLPSGYRIEVNRGFDVTTLRQLLSALERR